ncbi:hypothetical protein CR513_00149, partial [Mucuna pruriens]
MLGKPSINDVLERRNHILKDMSLWGEALKIVVYILNRVSSKGYKFYNPTSRFFFEIGNTRFLKEVEFKKEENIRNVVFVKEFVNDIVQVLIPITVQETTLVIEDNVQTIVPDIVLEQDYDERGHATPNDSIVFLQEHEDDIGLIKDYSINFCQAMCSSNSQKWINVIKDEMKSMQDNDILDLVELPKGMKPIGYKWIFKTEKDFKGNIERYKDCLVAKGFTYKEDIDYNRNFSLVSSKDSFRTIMVLVAHFDLELHQMDVKIVFLNGDINETIYMVQLENFVLDDSKSMVCKLKKFIYGLKHASCQWYHKFHQVITSYGFEANVVDNCVYHKLNGSKYIFLILYVDNILLASSDIGLLHENKRFLMKNF